MGVLGLKVKTNEVTTLCIPTEEEWRQDTADYNDMKLNKRVLSDSKIYDKGKSELTLKFLV